MKSIPNPGTYPAQTAGAMVVYETENGALCVAIPVKITGGTEVAWQGKHTVTLGKSDGTVQTKSIATLKKVFGWDGVNPFELEDLDTTAMEFEIVGEHQAYTPAGETEEVMTFKIQWLNPVGGSTNMPEKIDRKAALTKWGSKFKALSGTVAKPAAAKPAAPAAKSPPAKPAVSGPPGRKATAAMARTSTQEEVWNGLVAANEGADEADLGQKYYDACDEVEAGSSADPSLLDTPAKWGQVADKLGI